jgi:hypothetical protein
LEEVGGSVSQSSLFPKEWAAPVARALLASPALSERRRRRPAPRLVAVRRTRYCGRRVAARPHPLTILRGAGRQEDAAHHHATPKHVVVVIAPLAGRARSRCALEDQWRSWSFSHFKTNSRCCSNARRLCSMAPSSDSAMCVSCPAWANPSMVSLWRPICFLAAATHRTACARSSCLRGRVFGFGFALRYRPVLSAIVLCPNLPRLPASRRVRPGSSS